VDLTSILLRRLLASAVALPILAVVDVIMLVVSYGTLRVMRIPPRWPTLLIGYGLSTLMLWALWLTLVNPYTGGRFIAWSSLCGGLAFVVSIFAIVKWPTRLWYVWAKRRMGNWIIRPCRNFFLYLRDHHAFFGWLTLLASAVHTILIFPRLSSASTYEVWTGVAALVLLAVLAATGEWIAYATRTKHLSTRMRWLHLTLTFAFILAFAFHV
jgi:hypothetical protein